MVKKAVVLLALAVAFAIGYYYFRNGAVTDEAMRAGRNVESFPPAKDHYFQAMDGGVALTDDEHAGRNMWIVWSGGNDKFWDTIGRRSVGTLDFLKTISSYDITKDPNAPKSGEIFTRLSAAYTFGRKNRWAYQGMVNEPCYEAATGPDAERWGLWLDKAVKGPGCPGDPFENEANYPGVRIGSRGTTVNGKLHPVGSYYGMGTGIVGLRLFTNPDFDEEAAKKWDATRFYTDPVYYNDKNLVRPYRVGMSCGFCHVGPHPLYPPADPEKPNWENLSSNVGAQYFWVDRIFAWERDKSSFAFQLFHTSRAGALDTSLVSTDNINNPRTMNAVYGLKPRLEIAKRLHMETLAGGSLNNKQFNDYVPDTHPLAALYKNPVVWSPRVLKDGSDSVGALGALNRVFINIGLFSEEWLLHFNPLVGGKRITPIEIATARKNSAYWQATEAQSFYMAQFFLKATDPHRLADLKEGAPKPPAAAQLADGKRVFAERCARCHSSKLPALPTEADPGRAECQGSGYLQCFDKYWAHAKTDAFKSDMRKIVEAPDFLSDNFLSTDLRIPVTLLQTNACSPQGANAIAGNIWDNFSSKTYKELPAVGKIKVRHPVSGAVTEWEPPGGGRGYTRPASLISLWSTAPYLLNNTVGKLDAAEDVYQRYGYTPSPSVEARLWAFQDGITKMLWPEKREMDSKLGGQGVYMIDRTTHTSYLRVPDGYVPGFARGLLGVIPNRIYNDGEGIEIGPIPAGTPVNLLANLRVLAENTDLDSKIGQGKDLFDLLTTLKKDLKSLPENPTDEDARKAFANAVDKLVALSSCPDYEVNRGHYFGTNLFPEEPGLTDKEKLALIEFLKTF